MAITLSQTASAWRNPGALSHSVSFTTVAGDTDLIVAIRVLDSDAVTNVTFNGTALTQCAPTQKVGTNNDFLSFWRLSNPSVTTANITLTLNATRRCMIAALSLQGTNAGSSEDNDGTNGAATSSSLTMTSTTNQAWHIVASVQDASVFSSLTNVTIDVTENTVAFMYLGHYEATTAGNVTQTFNWTGSSQFAMVGVVIAPAGGNLRSRFTMLGVG